MNAKQLQDVSNKKGRSLEERVWWLATSLAILAALAIALAIHYAPASKATGSAVRAQSAPNAAAQAAAAWMRAHYDPSFYPQQMPDYGRLHDDPSFHAPQPLDRSFHTPQTSNYAPADRSFHTPRTSNHVAVDPSLRPQTVPNAGDPGVMNYLRAHGAVIAPRSAADYLHVPNSVRATYAP